jgi:DNA primase/predicted transcriptional regulator
MEIAQIKQLLSIESVLTHYGLTPDRNGMLSCPFHDDTTPSMQLYATTVHCFSTNCAQHGKNIDAIDFILHKEGCTKHEAIMKAKAMIGAAEPLKAVPESLASLYARMESALGRSSKARAYLTERGLVELQEVGYNPGTIYKGLRQCVVFGLRNEVGEVVSLYGRAIQDKGGRHFYTRNRRGLYPGYPAKETKRLILAESVIDAATLLQHTDEKVLALYGTNGLTDEHLKSLDNLPDLEEVVLFLDGDAAGEAAVVKWAEVLHNRYPKLTISQVATPEGEDVNGLVVSHEAAVLNHLIGERQVLFSSSESASTEKGAGRPPAPKGGETCAEGTSPIGGWGALDTTEPQLLNWKKENLRFTLLGGVALYPLDRLKVTLKMERTDTQSPQHRLRQQLDLYQDEAVEKLARKAAGRLEVGSTKLHTALLELTDKLEVYRAEKIAAQRKATAPEQWKLTPARQRRAIKFLSEEKLLRRTNELIAQTGVVGERTNRLLLWLTFTSRLRERPLHVICLGASGTGKTYLQEKIADLIPEDQKLEVTALSENALYYFKRTELKHKLVLIEDLDGAAEDKILYAIRELQSKRKITKTIPLKDAKGNLRTVTLCVEGPICLAGTTTMEKLYEDNANRSLLIYLDNGKEQREAIMAYQRKVSAGTVDQRAEDQARELLRDIQCVLKPVRVVNPFAEQLALPPEVFKPLRTNAHYLAFIETVTFYQQFQREQKRDNRGEAYVETTLEDIEAANKLLAEVLLAKSDELTKATRQFLDRLKGYLVKVESMSFYAGDIRKAFRLSPATVNRHLFVLVRYGNAKIVGGSRSGGYEYELVDEEERLRDKVENALENVLNKLKEQLGSSRVAQAESEQLNPQTVSDLKVAAQ